MGKDGAVAGSKLLYVILDGLGDDPVEAFAGRTPLEEAATPNLDELARRGATGVVTTVGEGIAPESDIAVFAVLGYDPFVHHTGRGPIEAVGAGLPFSSGDLAYRVNFATVTEAGEAWDIVDRRVGRDLTSAEAHALAAEVQEKVKLDDADFRFVATVGHRGVVVFYPRSGRFSAAVENSDPAYGRQGLLGVAKEVFDERVVHVTPLEGDEDHDAKLAADVTNRWLRAAYGVLMESEVNKRRQENGQLVSNFILTRDAGDHLPTLVPFAEAFGMSMGCFVELPVEIGIAKLTQMHEVEASTGIPPQQQYGEWAELAARAKDDHDGLYIHIKGPDVPAHDGDHVAKRRSIEEIDRFFFGPLLDRIDLSATTIAVTADHSTSCARKAHTDAAVPLLVVGAGVDADGVTTYGERSCSEGSLGHLLGPQIMPRLRDLTTRE